MRIFSFQGICTALHSNQWCIKKEACKQIHKVHGGICMTEIKKRTGTPQLVQGYSD